MKICCKVNDEFSEEQLKICSIYQYTWDIVVVSIILILLTIVSVVSIFVGFVIIIL